MLRRPYLLLAVGAFLSAGVMLPLGVVGCGNDVASEFGPPGGEEAGTGETDGMVFSPATDAEAGTQCTSGKACGDGGVCAGNVCCTATSACGDVCCGGTEVCSFQKCATPGAVCHDSSECGSGQYCEFTLGTATDGGVADAGTTEAGASCVSGVERTGRCLPRPPDCAADAGSTSDAGITCLEKCEYKPTTTFTPAQKFAWGGQLVTPWATDVMMAPIVIELDDDDCDGKVTERDIPEIVFSTFSGGNYGSAGKLHAISIVGGAFVDKWTVPNALNATVVNPTKQIAAGNFDGKPGNEVVACGVDGKLHAFKGTDGTELWASPVLTLCFMPAIADLEGDGTVEVIVEGAILNGADGTIKHLFVPAINGPLVISDLDSDGKLDVITSSRGYHADGTQFVDTNVATTASFPGTSDWKGAWAGIGDFDNDGKPEVVAVDNETHELMVWRYDAAAVNKFTIVRPLTDMNAQFLPANTCAGGTWGNLHGGGPPTVADFNHDGVPDVGLAGGIGYVVFDGKKLIDPAVTGANAILWSKVTTDCSSASTGSTVFDFDGDGKAEVVYSDERRMRIYDGTTGTELASFCNTTATLVEFPIVADVDNDGHADIIVASNAYNETCDDGMPPVATKQAGIRVFGAASGTWVRTRRVWNEHAYHITNVNEDGTIPTNELPNWKQPGLNNFRQNKQPGSEFAAPNVVALAAPLCPGPTGVVVTVRNIGEALVPAGVVVGVYAGVPPTGVKIGSVTTTRALYPAESEPLELLLAIVPATVYTVVDDGAPPHPAWHECRTDDNTSAAVSTACIAPH
ncbi:MAG: Hemolysin-related protein RbmC [Myxococcaceae bacterium]|nr:Hemolysin-related protein RbmC [Myxococcaceae bacterium]